MDTIYLVASGDLRLSANQVCWQTQADMEALVMRAVSALGGKIERAHPYDPVKRHGFIDSQKYGMEVFKHIPPRAPLIVAEAVWQYSHHVLAGLYSHKGPILTVANWSGQWPGLVGMLNLNASLTKAGVKYSTLWSEQFDDGLFLDGLAQWMKKGSVKHEQSHVRKFDKHAAPDGAVDRGKALARRLKADKAILGVFDEGCMGMYNAIIPDELLHKTGVFKERLSQSALVAKMRTVTDAEARAVYDWLLTRGMRFHFGQDEATELTEAQVLNQCRMYIAALRIADEFGCGAIGIQYQQGLKDMTCASDLVEGMLNNTERPPVTRETDGAVLFDGEALPHFNEVDECAGLDALVTYRLWREMGLPPETTLHDLRWGRAFPSADAASPSEFVWVLEISGAVPPAHFAEGWKSAVGERQPPMFFPLGGSTIKGVSKPGWIVWSRVFVADNRLNFDTGIARAVELPEHETEERWRLTNSQWPLMHLVLRGITRDQMMARHKSNHIQVVYAPDYEAAAYGMYAKAAAMKELGLKVSVCGEV